MVDLDSSEIDKNKDTCKCAKQVVNLSSKQLVI